MDQSADEGTILTRLLPYTKGQSVTKESLAKNHYTKFLIAVCWDLLFWSKLERQLHSPISNMAYHFFSCLCTFSLFSQIFFNAKMRNCQRCTVRSRRQWWPNTKHVGTQRAEVKYWSFVYEIKILKLDFVYFTKCAEHELLYLSKTRGQNALILDNRIPASCIEIHFSYVPLFPKLELPIYPPTHCTTCFSCSPLQ